MIPNNHASSAVLLGFILFVLLLLFLALVVSGLYHALVCIPSDCGMSSTSFDSIHGEIQRHLDEMEWLSMPDSVRQAEAERAQRELQEAMQILDALEGPKAESEPLYPTLQPEHYRLIGQQEGTQTVTHRLYSVIPLGTYELWIVEPQRRPLSGPGMVGPKCVVGVTLRQ